MEISIFLHNFSIHKCNAPLHLFTSSFIAVCSIWSQEFSMGNMFKQIFIEIIKFKYNNMVFFLTENVFSAEPSIKEKRKTHAHRNVPILTLPR